MKTCPICKTSYEDNTIEKCAKDGAALEAVQSVPENPALPEIMAAPSDAVTSDFDIEEVKNEQEKQAATPSVTQEPIQESVSTPTTQIAEAVSAPKEAAGPPENVETLPKNRLKSTWLFAALAFLLVAGSSIGFYFWFYKSNLVEVHLHSVPPGAEAVLDGKKIGMTPVMVRIKKGTHQILFEQVGYQSVKEMITVAADGHILVKKMIPIVNPSP